MPHELSRLVMTTTCSQSFIRNLIKYITMVDENERVAMKALRILNSFVTLVQPHSDLVLMLTSHNV